MGREPSEVERVEREEFARGHIGPEDEPVEPRPAATVVLAREGDEGLETLLLRRPERARFAAGAYVFPGGAIDAGDRDRGLAAILAGPGGAERAETAALAAGLRELFEETGILLADRLPAQAALERAREALLADRLTFRELAESLDLTFRKLRAVYFARWITPERLARRYDTRFFVAVSPEGAEPRLTPEHTERLWIRPARALEQFHAGELPMLFPTWKTLEGLRGFGGLEEALAELARREVKAIQARLVVDGERVHPVMPGDPEYEAGR